MTTMAERAIADMSSSALWARWRALKALRERERVGDVFCSGGREGVAIVGHRGGIAAGRPKKHRGQS
jgi:hypothetical protein